MRKQAATILVSFLLAVSIAPALAQLEKPVEELMRTFNDDDIEFNDKLVVLGKPDAKATAIVIYGLSGDTTYFMNRIFPDIRRRYVDSGRMRAIIYDFPLTWHDMQALAGMRCLPADKHLEALQFAVATQAFAFRMRSDTILNAPRHVVPLLRKLGLEEPKAQQCIRNLRVIGHLEAIRKLAVEQWDVSYAPTVIVGANKFVNPQSLGALTDFLDKHVGK